MAARARDGDGLARDVLREGAEFLGRAIGGLICSTLNWLFLEEDWPIWTLTYSGATQFECCRLRSERACPYHASPHD